MGNDASDGDSPSSFDADGPAGDGRSLDALFAALANRRSRLVLSHLEAVDVDVVVLDDLVDHVVEREARVRADATSEEYRENVGIELHHNRLPKLDEAAVLDYDPRSQTVRYWGDERVRACLEIASDLGQYG